MVNQCSGSRRRTRYTPLLLWRCHSAEVSSKSISSHLSQGLMKLNSFQVPNETAHPSKALGIAHLRILTSPENIPVVSDRISCVCGKSPDRIADSGVLRWDLETVAVGGRSTLLFLDAPTDEHDYGSGSSIFEVGFHVQSIPSPGNETTTTPYGRIRWLVAPSINQA